MRGQLSTGMGRSLWQKVVTSFVVFVIALGSMATIVLPSIAHAESFGGITVEDAEVEKAFRAVMAELPSYSTQYGPFLSPDCTGQAYPINKKFLAITNGLDSINGSFGVPLTNPAVTGSVLDAECYQMAQVQLLKKLDSSAKKLATQYSALLADAAKPEPIYFKKEGSEITLTDAGVQFIKTAPDSLRNTRTNYESQFLAFTKLHKATAQTTLFKPGYPGSPTKYKTVGLEHPAQILQAQDSSGTVTKKLKKVSTVAFFYYPYRYAYNGFTTDSSDYNATTTGSLIGNLVNPSASFKLTTGTKEYKWFGSGDDFRAGKKLENIAGDWAKITNPLFNNKISILGVQASIADINKKKFGASEPLTGGFNQSVEQVAAQLEDLSYGPCGEPLNTASQVFQNIGGAMQQTICLAVVNQITLTRDFWTVEGPVFLATAIGNQDPELSAKRGQTTLPGFIPSWISTNVINPALNSSARESSFQAIQDSVQTVLFSNTNPFANAIKNIQNSMLSIVNVAFVIGLLLLALANILQLQVNTYSLKKALPGLVLGFIMANVSFFAIRAFVEVMGVISTSAIGLVGNLDESPVSYMTNQLASILIDPKTQAISDVPVAPTTTPAATTPADPAATPAPVETVKKINYEVLFIDPNSPKNAVRYNWGTIMVASVLALGVTVACIYLICIGFLFVIRFIVFLILIPVAPIAVFGAFFPPLGFIWKRWWKALRDWGLMPAISLGLIGMGILFMRATSEYAISTGDAAQTVSAGARFFNFAIGLYFLHTALTQPFKLAGEFKVVMDKWSSVGATIGMNALNAVGVGNVYRGGRKLLKGIEKRGDLTKKNFSDGTTSQDMLSQWGAPALKAATRGLRAKKDALGKSSLEKQTAEYKAKSKAIQDKAENSRKNLINKEDLDTKRKTRGEIAKQIADLENIQSQGPLSPMQQGELDSRRFELRNLDGDIGSIEKNQAEKEAQIEAAANADARNATGGKLDAQKLAELAENPELLKKYLDTNSGKVGAVKNWLGNAYGNNLNRMDSLATRGPAVIDSLLMNFEKSAEIRANHINRYQLEAQGLSDQMMARGINARREAEIAEIEQRKGMWGEYHKDMVRNHKAMMQNLNSMYSTAMDTSTTARRGAENEDRKLQQWYWTGRGAASEAMIEMDIQANAQKAAAGKVKDKATFKRTFNMVNASNIGGDIVEMVKKGDVAKARTVLSQVRKDISAGTIKADSQLFDQLDSALANGMVDTDKLDDIVTTHGGKFADVEEAKEVNKAITKNVTDEIKSARERDSNNGATYGNFSKKYGKIILAGKLHTLSEQDVASATGTIMEIKDWISGGGFGNDMLDLRAEFVKAAEGLTGERKEAADSIISLLTDLGNQPGEKESRAVYSKWDTSAWSKLGVGAKPGVASRNINRNF